MMSRESPSELLAKTTAAHFLTDIVGVGIDLVDVTVMRALLDEGGRSFVDACWTTGEQEEINDHPDRLAARWAAKEAVMKALRSGIGEVDPLDVEILLHPSGAPFVRLNGKAGDIARSLGIGSWHVSLTHESSWAAAIAIAEGKSK